MTADELTEKRKQLYAEFIRPELGKALIPPVIRRNVPYRYYPEVDDYTMSMGMDVTPGGRIWIGHFAGGDDERAVIVLSKSDDHGKTFSDPQFILDPGYASCGLHLSVVVGNLWSAPDGRLFLFFTMSVGYYDGRAGSWYAVCENPDAEEPVWSVPVRIWHGISLNKPTVLRSGEWMFPIVLWGRFAMNPEGRALPGNGLGGLLFPELDPLRKTHLFVSADQGKTWQERGSVKNPDEIFDETMVAEREDGSLLLLMRTFTGICQSESYDGGKSWSEPVRWRTKSACARFFLRKLSSGNLLLVRNANEQIPDKRSHMTAFLSVDGGKSWKGGLLLDADDGVSYPDGFQAADGTVYVQYDYRRQGGEIRLASFREEDVLAGKAVSGKVLLKHPVIRSFSMRKESADPVRA